MRIRGKEKGKKRDKPKNKKCVGIVAAAVFLATYVPLMAKFFAVVMEEDGKVRDAAGSLGFPIFPDNSRSHPGGHGKILPKYGQSPGRWEGRPLLCRGNGLV